eukprot:7208388-Alexandrium_andersonii.AAC.1
MRRGRVLGACWVLTSRLFRIPFAPTSYAAPSCLLFGTHFMPRSRACARAHAQVRTHAHTCTRTHSRMRARVCSEVAQRLRRADAWDAQARLARWACGAWGFLGLDFGVQASLSKRTWHPNRCSG